MTRSTIDAEGVAICGALGAVMMWELLNIGHTGTAPSINRLAWITHSSDGMACPKNHMEEMVLGQ